MSEVKEVRLGDVLKVHHGFAFKSSEFSDDLSYPTIVTPGNFSIGGGFKDAKPKTFSGDFPPSYELAPGDLVVTMTDLSKQGDTLGMPAVIPSDRRYLHNQRIGLVEVLEPNEVSKSFLAYYLRTRVYKEYVLGTASGSTVRHTSPSRIEDFVAHLPKINTQHAIAEVLGALDDKIAANNRTIKIGESLSTALLQGIPPSIPLANIVSQRRKTVNPSNLDVEATAHFSLPAFDDKKRPVYCRPDEIKSNKVLIDFPSVLMSKLNPRFPRIWSILNLPDSPALASTEFVVLTPKEISVPLLWAILSQRRFSLELATKVSGTSGSHQRVKPEDMLSSAVIDPNSVGQEAIGLINETAELLLKLGNENNQLSVLRDALLPQLMSGKIRVRDAEAIVEDVL